MSDNEAYKIPNIGIETFYATIGDDNNKKKRSYLVTTLGDKKLFDCIHPIFNISFNKIDVKSSMIYQPFSISVCVEYDDEEVINNAENKKSMRAITIFVYNIMCARACEFYKSIVYSSADNDDNIDRVMYDTGIYDEIKECEDLYNYHIEESVKLISRDHEFAAFVEPYNCSEPIEIISSFDDSEQHEKMLKYIHPAF